MTRQPDMRGRTIRPHAELNLSAHYAAVRAQSLKLCEPLETEDYGVQPMADASPPKWHLAHTTWFFETFVLKQAQDNYQPFNRHFEHLFNSYYNGVGTPYPRHQRGFLSRPTVAEIVDYRERVDEGIQRLLGSCDDGQLVERIAMGLQHEQQHQELLLTDIKYNFGHNPLYPEYGGYVTAHPHVPTRTNFAEYAGGLVEVGADKGFCFDNEQPQHDVLLYPFKLADRLVTNAEYAAFIADGGYQTPQWWLSEGWSVVQQQAWKAPLYWSFMDGQWMEYRLDGLYPIVESLPVVHVSGHEAFAFAAWSNARLPTEFEWEHVAASRAIDGTFVESTAFHPQALSRQTPDIQQLFGDVWQWTSSSYGPYPGYQPLPGTLGEYNGKFMSSQLVLRGGSCATPQAHVRASYRNFFYPPDRWQFSGIRLAKDA